MGVDRVVVPLRSIPREDGWDDWLLNCIPKDGHESVPLIELTDVGRPSKQNLRQNAENKA